MARAAAWISLGVLVAGVAVAAWQWRRNTPAPAPAPTPAAALDVTDEAGVEQALRQQPVTTGPERNRWVGEVRGIGVSGLSARQLDVFVRFANAERCTCGCGYTLAGCRSYDPTCEVSGPIILALRDSVARDQVASVANLRRPPSGTPRSVDR